MPGPQFWANYFLTIFTPQIDAYGQCLLSRVMPTFANLDDEAQKVEDDAAASMSSGFDDEEPDLASIAELARDRAVDYYMLMRDTAQGIVTLFAVGLWHLLEQQLALYVRRGLAASTVDETKNPSFTDAEKALADEGVLIRDLPCYPKIQELRFLANCAKHGDGGACSSLRAIRPDLFIRPGLKMEWIGSVPDPVISPLGGEHLYVSEGDFSAYIEAVRGFWSELGDHLSQQFRNRRLGT